MRKSFLSLLVCVFLFIGCTNQPNQITDYVDLTFTNTSDPIDTYSFWLTSGPAQGSDPARYTTFTKYEVPSHTIRDMGGGDGSHLLASSSPMDEEYGEYIPSDGNYPFDSFVMYVPGAINAS